MKMILFSFFFFVILTVKAQSNVDKLSNANIRLSFLIFPPFTPLLTFEMRTIEKITIQVETNFINTHGFNIKYFIKEPMSGHFIFIGSAFLASEFLRKDKKIAFLPYIGYGYAYRFGKSKVWTFENRLGIGATLNADKNIVLPVLKTGIGKIF